MSFENPLWGAPKIHGELLKLGIEVAQSTVSIYMVPRPDRPLQTWKTFLCNHMEGIASIDLLIPPAETCGQKVDVKRPHQGATLLAAGASASARSCQQGN